MPELQKLATLGIETALLSQGPVIREATAQFTAYEKKLDDFRPDYLRGYPVSNLSPSA